MKTYAQAPYIRPIYNPYSIKYSVFVDGQVKEHLITIAKRGMYKEIRINYSRVKFWLKQGVKMNRTILINFLNTNK